MNLATDLFYSVSLDESLRVLNKYVRDSIDEERPLDEVLIPMIENVINFLFLFFIIIIFISSVTCLHFVLCLVILDWIF